METLIRLAVQYAHWIYAICGFIALFNIYRTWQIRAERRQAVFTLERQKAIDDLYKILFSALVLLAVMGTTYFLSDVVATAMGIQTPSRSISQNFGSNPATAAQGELGAVDGSGNDNPAGSLEGDASEGSSDSGTNSEADTGNQPASAEENERATNDAADGSSTSSDSTGSGTSANGELDSSGDTNAQTTSNSSSRETTNPSAQVNANNQTDSSIAVGTLPTQPPPQPTPTFTYAPPAPPPTSPPPAPPTIVPTSAPVVTAPSCPDPRAQIAVPGNGAIVNGSFNIVGTAVHEQFQFYKLEYAPGASTDQTFVYLAGGSDPINGGVLGTADSTNWANGVWTIRIVVVDQTGNFPPPCNVTVTVSN